MTSIEMKAHLMDSEFDEENFIETQPQNCFVKHSQRLIRTSRFWIVPVMTVSAFWCLASILLVILLSGPSSAPSEPSPDAKLSSYAPVQAHQDWGPDATTVFLLSKPEVIPAGSKHEFQQRIDRAEFGLAGNIMLKELSFRIVDPDTHQPIPLEWIYNHHTVLVSDRDGFTAIMAWGAEGARSNTTKFSPFEGFFIGESERLLFAADWLDVYGKLATTNQTAIAEIKITFVRVTDTTAVQHAHDNRLNYQLLGAGLDNEGAEIALPPGPLGEATCITAAQSWNYDSIRIYHLVGHLHFGAINETLIEDSTGKVLASAMPRMDQYGYVVRLDTNFTPGFELKRGQSYTTIGCYANRRDGYSGVMALWAGYYENLDHPSVIALPDF